MQNETILKFGYPGSVLQEYEHWVVLLRPKQVTLGSLVLACKGEATQWGAVAPQGFTELAAVTAELEQCLQRTFQPDRLNYLMLMMVDKHVHFHVIPRYAAERQAIGVTFVDRHWPKPPLITDTQDLSDDQLQALTELLRGAWSGGG